MKKQSYEILAAQYFIENQMSIAEIARRLSISEKTLHNWKNDGQWVEKRNRFLKSQYSTNHSLYEFLNLILEKALDDFKNEGIMPDQKTTYFIMNMAGKLPQLKQYESSMIKEKSEELNEQQPVNDSQDKASTDDMLQKFFSAVMEG